MDYTFYECYSLSQVTIPNSVTSIGSNAFYNCTSLTEITIPNSVTSIGDDAFEDCYGLTKIAIPASVTQIGTNPFAGCISMTDLTVDPNNPYYHMDGNCLIETDTKILISGFADSVIPNGITSIGTYAFVENLSLTEITIPDSVTSIEWATFGGCSSLTRVYFEHPEGWTMPGGEPIPTEQLADPERAAKFLVWSLYSIQRAD